MVASNFSCKEFHWIKILNKKNKNCAYIIQQKIVILIIAPFRLIDLFEM